MMDDVIYRQAAIDALTTECSWTIYDEHGQLTPNGEEILGTLKNVPSAQHKPFCYLDSPCPYQNEEIKVTQKKGHWIDTDPDEPLDPRQTCSECGNTEILYSANFCPNCGADMRGETGGDISDS